MHIFFENAPGYVFFFYFFCAPLPLSSPLGDSFSAIFFAAPQAFIQATLLLLLLLLSLLLLPLLILFDHIKNLFINLNRAPPR